MTIAADYCDYCDSLPCDCESQDVHPRFAHNIVDPEDRSGFNPVEWSQTVQAKKPIRLDPVSGALWSYGAGVWSEDRKVVEHTLPMVMGKNYRRPKHLGTVIDRIRAEMVHHDRTIHPDNPEPRYVSTPSGLFDIETGKVVGHSPDVLTTYQIQVDPEFDTPTTEFDAFLESVLHPGDRDRVLDILAYLLLPGNPRQKAVMFSGRGRNGKGILLRVVRAIVGDSNISTVALSKMGTRFAAAHLYGKPLNIVGDIDGEHITNTGAFKMMTGDDLVHMDVKNAQAFSAKVWAVPVFSANQIPTSADTSDGYLRRWEVVEFPNTFDGSDTTLFDRLLDELPAITGKLLQHAHRNPFHIRTSEPGQRAHTAFANRSDPVRTWLAETELEGFTERKAAYLNYEFWIRDGNGKTALTKGNFYSRVSAVLGDPKTRKGARGWEFVSVPEPVPDPFQPELTPE
ncbi:MULTISPECIES: DNA primase family protein [Mycolicibacterium]|uniref:DNA primase family protein n=1 Tax=Mycolicibacterium TaxID=1866885 RepID=UPI000A077427|nr:MULTISPECIES: phage/plasmid primase, P4 family [Mycolicibacterium]UJL26840.1 hypothetical protein HZU38_17945 [Mycolicibacterium vanbaalenii]WND58961.1 phage/plasmid primase, P4 family [Mycolicibacterium vanbaalenii]